MEIEGYQITGERHRGGQGIVYEALQERHQFLSDQLDDVNTPQRVSVASLNTRVLTLEVTSVFAAEAAGEQAPFNELAVADIRFFGSLAGDES